MYARFHKAYCGINCFEMLLNVLSFIEKGPFVIIDSTKTNPSRALSIEYCLLSNVVRKIM